MKTLERIRRSISHINAVARCFQPRDGLTQSIRNTGYFLLLADLFGISPKERVISIEYQGHAVDFEIGTVADYSLLYDILIEEEYALSRNQKQVSTLVDIGSHIGVSALYFRFAFPQAQIVCVEPDLNNFRHLSANTNRIPGIIPYNFAVGKGDFEVEFFENTKRGVSSSLFRRNSKQQVTRVQSVSFETLLQTYVKGKVDLLKFDIEGAEYDFFRQAHDLRCVNAYIGELHTDLMDVTVKRFCGLFNGFSIQTKQLSAERYIFYACRTEDNS